MACGYYAKLLASLPSFPGVVTGEKQEIITVAPETVLALT